MGEFFPGENCGILQFLPAYQNPWALSLQNVLHILVITFLNEIPQTEEQIKLIYQSKL